MKTYFRFSGFTIAIFLMSVLLGIENVHGQNVDKLQTTTIPSPTAASLGVYGKIPVSLYTGQADIAFTLYEINDGNINVPIVLRYNTSGVRPEELPSWVGSNWSLHAGGAITRITRTLPDEADFQYSNNSYSNNPGYYYNASALSASDWYAYTNFNSVEGAGIDTEPDEFNFNFNGHSGTFYLNHLGNWQVKSDEDITIAPINPSNDLVVFSNVYQHKYFKQFKLTTPDGTQYTFGGDDKASIEFTRPKYDEPFRKPVATTWYLTQIKSTDGYTVDFVYKRGNPIAQLGYYQYTQKSTMNSSSWTYSGSYASSACTQTTQNAYATTCQIIEPSYLESITTRNTRVTFFSNQADDLPLTMPSDISATNFGNTYSGGYSDILQKTTTNYNINPCLYDATSTYSTNFTLRKKLYNISIYKYNNNDNVLYPNNCPEDPNATIPEADAVKWFDFSYVNNQSKRLLLDNVMEWGVGIPSDKAKQYKFTYYDDGLIELPAYNTFQIDHWGFYNGKVSKQYWDPFTYFDTREPNSDARYAVEGMLKTIQYPTAGITTLEYEPHTFSEEYQRYSTGQSAVDGVNMNQLGVTKTAGGLRIKRITNNPVVGKQIVTDYIYTKSYSNTNTAGLSSGVLTVHPQYFWNASLTAVTGNTTGTYNFFSSHSTLPLMANQEAHVSYREVVEKRSDGSYTRHSFTVPQYFNPFQDPYPPYQDKSYTWPLGNSTFDQINSLSLERGKERLIEVFDNQDHPVKTKELKYNSDPNRFSQFVRSRDNHTMATCDNNAMWVHGSAIKIFTYPFYVEQEIETDYQSNVPRLTETISYTYTPKKQVRKITKALSDGGSIITFFLYPYDYTDGSGFIKIMNDNHIYSPVETVNYKIAADGSTVILSGQVTTYKANFAGKPDNIYILQNSQSNPTPLAKFRFSNQTVIGQIPDDNTKSNFALTLSANANELSYYVARANLQTVDVTNGNVLDYKAPGGIVTATVWGYNQSFPIAKVANSTIDKVAYTSFEYKTDHGNWTYTDAQILDASSKTGRYYLNLSSVAITKSLPAGDYALEFWAKGAVTVTGATVTDLITLSADANGWIFYKKKISLTASGTVSLASSSGTVGLDELRLYPINATMDSYTYEPTIGITSATNQNGIISYYEYDNFLRLSAIKDQDGNIVKTYEYSFQVK